jgi:hypothetical protein
MSFKEKSKVAVNKLQGVLFSLMKSVEDLGEIVADAFGITSPIFNEYIEYAKENNNGEVMMGEIEVKNSEILVKETV